MVQIDFRPELTVEISKCSYCGSSDGFYTNHRVYGWIQIYYDQKGNDLETDNDGMQMVDTRRVRCVDCDRIQSRLIQIDGFIRSKKEVNEQQQAN